MEKSVFILSTPPQAFFLSLTPELMENGILILTVKSHLDAKKILAYIGDLKWKKVFTWYIPKNNNRIEYFKFFILKFNFWKFTKLNTNIKKVFFGSYVNQYHLSFLAEFERNSEIYLLYDGLQMISAAHFRKNDVPLIQEHPGLMQFLGFKKPLLKNISYVSPISLNLPERDSLYLIQSSKSFINKIYDSNLIFFIGQPITEKGVGVVKMEFYLKILATIKEHHPDKEIIYIAHPRESNKTLEPINQLFRVKKFNTVFEQYYLMSDRLPGKIYSFYSSVLLNLIFLGTQCEINSIKIPDSEFLGDYKEKIKPIYNYFEKILFKKFRLIEV